MSYLNRRRKSNSFTDFLFNILLVFLVMLAILLMLPKKPQEAEGDIQVKAEYLIILTWDEASTVDLDLWIKLPSDRIIFFKQKSGQGIRLERDDLGSTSDMVGSIVVPINEEIATIRGTRPGEYIINAHVYGNLGQPMSELRASLRIVQLNPYFETFKSSHLFTEIDEEHTFVRIIIDDKGKVIETDTEYFQKLTTGAL